MGKNASATAALALAFLSLAVAPAPRAQEGAPNPTAEAPADAEPAADLAAPAPGALSPRNASYTIEVRLEPEAKRLMGQQVLRWRNIQDVPADELRFHLYWNGWRNDHSTWMREERLTGDLPGSIRDDAWGWIDVDSIRLIAGDDEIEVTADAYFDSPDDGNPEDRTVLVVPLSLPVAPGESVEVAMDWQSKVPRTFARTGFRGDFFFVAHWFPKLGVFEGADGWACHQFHSNTEFYSDYGVYDVTIIAPERFVVGATGREVPSETSETVGEGPDGDQVAHRYVQEDVHAFTWTASPDYRVATDRFEVEGLPPVDLRLLYQPEHEHQVERHFAATKHTLELYGTWYGPYPYDHLTVVDPAWEAGAGGMEYPTLFTSGTRLFNPIEGGRPEGVTIHEAGHQFWYGVVGNDEFEHAWLDEGLNTFSTARVYDEAYGRRAEVVRFLRPPGTSWGGFLPAVFHGVRETRGVGGNRLDRYRRNADRDVPATPTYLYYPRSHGSISYSKTAVWLATLERHLGWEVLREILSTFYQRWSFRHPEPEDFFAVANEVTRARLGYDLDWFFDQVHRDDVSFDYAIERVSSSDAALRGMVEEDGEVVLADRDEADDETEESDEDETVYRTEVVARRIGAGVFPVEVELVFEDGSRERRFWDGRGRWRLFVHEGPSKLEYAVVDPEETLLLDLDRTNNSRLRENPGRLAPAKWSSRWMIWLQDLMQTFTAFV
jgi:hypothetical protein